MGVKQVMYRLCTFNLQKNLYTKGPSGFIIYPEEKLEIPTKEKCLTESRTRKFSARKTA
jgi:hypothetical protein